MADELEWTSVFWDVRQESLQNFSLALSLNSLTPFQANPQPLLELSCRHFFEVIDLPQWVQVWNQQLERPQLSKH